MDMVEEEASDIVFTLEFKVVNSLVLSHFWYSGISLTPPWFPNELGSWSKLLRSFRKRWYRLSGC